jgi:flagella basal body P-ring formation protein FlgA
MYSWFLNILIIICCATALSVADGGKHEITLRGRSYVWVTKKQVTVSDLMDIEVNSKTNSESAIAIGKLEVMASPKLGSTVEINGGHLLDVLQKAELDLNKVGYVIPRLIKLVRKSRELRKEDVEPLILKYITKHEGDSSLNRIVMPTENKIFTGKVKFMIGTPVDQGSGRLRFPITAESSDAERVKVDVDVFVSRFKEIPVSKHSLERDEVVNKEDVVRARINLDRAPNDLVMDEAELDGFKVGKSVASGQFFQKRFLKLVPLINVGAPVTIRYSKGLIEATATGIALDDGVEGSAIRVRNETSKKIVKGRIISEGLVEVGA